jgi:hypothetical protein
MEITCQPNSSQKLALDFTVTHPTSSEAVLFPVINFSVTRPHSDISWRPSRDAVVVVSEMDARDKSVYLTPMSDLGVKAESRRRREKNTNKPR